MIEVTKAGASAWKQMDEEGRKPFEAKALVEKVGEPRESLPFAVFRSF